MRHRDVFYKSQNELLQKLNGFKALDLENTPYTKILDIINKEIFLPITVCKLHSNQYVERIRINKPDEIFTAQNELSYIRNPQVIKTFSRANAPGQSMFYGSVSSRKGAPSRIVALAETEEALQGDRKGFTDKKFIITTGRWKVINDLTLSEMVFKKEAIDTISDVKRAFEQQYMRIRQSNSKFHTIQIVAVLNFYSEEFAKRVHKDTDYKISAAFTESLLKLENFQGVIYQSVQTDFSGTNIALTPKTVDENLVLEEALIIAVEIRGKRVFLNNLFRTGELKPGQEKFGWYKMDETMPEVIEQYFATGILPTS